MNLYDYLRNLRDEMPPWIERFGGGDRFSRQEFFGSRVVYYPGSGADGHPVKLFGFTYNIQVAVLHEVPDGLHRVHLCSP
jgi:hypothetical protein